MAFYVVTSSIGLALVVLGILLANGVLRMPGARLATSHSVESKR